MQTYSTSYLHCRQAPVAQLPHQLQPLSPIETIVLGASGLTHRIKGAKRPPLPLAAVLIGMMGIVLIGAHVDQVFRSIVIPIFIHMVNMLGPS